MQRWSCKSQKKKILRKEFEISCDIEDSYEALVEELTEKLSSVLHNNQEETCLEIEDVIEELDHEFQFDVRKE